MISQEEGLRLRRFTKRVFLVQGVRVFQSISLLHLLFVCCWADSSPFPPGLVPGIYESLVKHERKEMPNFLTKCVHSPQQHFGQMPAILEELFRSKAQKSQAGAGHPPLSLHNPVVCAAADSP